MKNTIFITFLIITKFSFNQNLSFTNLNLKNLLLTENCLDINGDEIGDSFIDLNSDNEIQVSEASMVENLVLSSINFTITSISDLHQFTNLKRLTIYGDIGLLEISNLSLDSLVHIRISDHNSITNIDLSDLANLQSIFIEGLSGLNSLNIQNGSAALQNFSLFYTYFNTACVDSIAAEYNLVAQHLINGDLPSINCTLNISTQQEEPTLLYPNPSTGNINIQTDLAIQTVVIHNTKGKEVYEGSFSTKIINTSNFEKGLYILTIKTQQGVNYQYKIIIE